MPGTVNTLAHGTAGATGGSSRITTVSAGGGTSGTWRMITIFVRKKFYINNVS